MAIKRLSLRPPKGWNGRGENPVRALVRAEVAILRELREARLISPYISLNLAISPYYLAILRELREARHIVRLLDYVEDARSSALVMELLQP